MGAQEPSYQDLLRRLESSERMFMALMDENAQLREEIIKLKDTVTRLKRNSSNSSKPPSSDIIKPPGKKPRGRGRRKGRPGAKPGHQPHFREPFAEDRIDAKVDHTMTECPCCAGRVEPRGEPTATMQSVELVERPFVITQHEAKNAWCPNCRTLHQGRVPGAVRAQGLFGPRLTATVAYLKGGCHASYSTIQTFLSELLGVDVSRGFLAKVVRRTSNALGIAYDELCSQLPREARLNIDETGHKENGQRMWTWVFCAPDYTMYAIDPSRSSGVLKRLLGKDFGGVIGCDLFSAYRKYIGEHNVVAQYCMAHLIREVRFFEESSDNATANYGKRLLAELRKLFRTIHRAASLSDAALARRLSTSRDAILRVGKNAPNRDGPRQMAKRLRDYGRDYFTFITTPGIYPTNNIAERALRFIVVDRKITQGTRSPTGRRWCERIWTAIATCRQQCRSVCDFIHQTLTALAQNLPPPSFLPARA
jgi:transposase